MRYSKDVSELISERRAEVVEMAFNIFAEKSIEATTMVDIAKACGFGVASVYRYFGTKSELAVAAGTKKWRDYYEEIEKIYRKTGGEKMTAAEELEFYIDSYIRLYDRHKDLLKFNSNFDMFVIHENISAEIMKPYYDSVSKFADKFHTVCEKANEDKTVRVDIPEKELFYTVMYTMLTAAAKYAAGVIYPADLSLNYKKSLLQLKAMLMSYYCGLKYENY